VNAEQSPMLSVVGLTAGYGRLPVVHDIGLSVAAGAYLGIVGANGAGKSTLLRAVSGVVALRSGTVHVAGIDVSTQPAWRRWKHGMAFVPESRELFGPLTVEENLRAGCLNVPRAHRPARVAEAYELFSSLVELRTRTANQLSGGQQQTLAIARAVVSHPKVLLLDEPSLGLSPIAVTNLVESLSALRRSSNTAVVIAEQSLTVVRETCESVIVLSLGRDVGSGTADSVLTRNVIESAFL